MDSQVTACNISVFAEGASLGGERVFMNEVLRKFAGVMLSTFDGGDNYWTVI